MVKSTYVHGFKNPERELYAYFLGPISKINKVVSFIVPKGEEILKIMDD